MHSKRTNLELASPQKRCEFHRCHWLYMTGVVESPYYALHTSVSRNVAGLPGTGYLHSSGPAEQLRASRTCCQRCPKIGPLIAELACSSSLLTEWDKGRCEVIGCDAGRWRKGWCFGETCCLHLQSHFDSVGAGSMFLRNVGIIYQAVRHHTLEHTKSLSLHLFGGCPRCSCASALYFTVVLILFIPNGVLNNASTDTCDS